MAEYSRSISPTFLEALQEGSLKYFLYKVKKDKDLELCFRGNDKAVCIYYNNQMVWKIYEMASKSYKVEVSLHKSASKIIRESVKQVLREHEFCFLSKYGNELRYPYIIRKKFDERFVSETCKELKNMIDEYFAGNKHLEKMKQQELFREINDRYYVYDLEVHQAGEKKEGQNLPDMLGIRYEGEEPKAIVQIEVKSTNTACKDNGNNPGIQTHINAMEDYQESDFMVNRKKEAAEILKQYKELEIHLPPCKVPDPNKLDKEIIMILTNDAIKYYKDHRDEIETKSCKMFKWENNKLKEW